MNYKRVFIQNSYVHIIIVAYNRSNIFIKNIDLLKKSIQNSHKYFNYKIEAICVLCNHIHMILNCSNINEYPKIITSIKYYFSRHIDDVGVETPTYSYTNKKEKGIFQRRYFEHTIVSKNDLINQINYIHYNPVKHGLVQNVQDWKHSSFHEFVKLGQYEKNWGNYKDIEDIKSMDLE